MSGRKLGGGRILGSGKGLALSPSTSPSPATGALRAASPSAPSEISAAGSDTFSSSVSPPVLGLLGMELAGQDLASNIRVGSSSAAAQCRLLCPICEEEMTTLLQLNRHIDDLHQELPEAEQDEVKTWFDKQVRKAKRFQPLSLINQKLRGLDVFESNESIPVLPSNGSTRAGPSEATTASPEDSEEVVTRNHWQRSTGSDLCTDPTCGKRLGSMNGNVNCRKCGRLFCEEHTMYQMKLSRSAQHEPVRGCWCRVCETCYKSREGYNDHSGLLVDRTAAFVEMRRKKVERQNLESQRLEKRLTKLTRLLAGAQEEGDGGFISHAATLAGQKSQRKAIEQSVVAWEDDADVSKCPFCQQEFGSWTFRRHHCRICGRVVCADPATACSSEVGLNVTRSSSQPEPFSTSTEKPPPFPDHQLSLDIRMCRDCKTTIFSHRDFAASLAHKPPDQLAYETLREFERGIRQLTPSFQKALSALQPTSRPGAPPPTHAQIQEAAKLRKRLTDSFAKYDAAARRLRDLKTTSETQLRLQKAVYTASSNFLHANLIPLKSIPRMLMMGEPAAPSHSRSSSSSSVMSMNQRRFLGASPLRHDYASSFAPKGDEETASEASTAALETEERELRERLAVLEEQRFMVIGMAKNAKGARRIEEAQTLGRNLGELDREIEGLRERVGAVEARWECVFAQRA